MRRPPGERRCSRLQPGACAHAGVPLRSALLLAAAAAAAAAVIEVPGSPVATTVVGALPVELRWRQRQLQQQGAAGGHSRSAQQTRQAGGGDAQRQTDEVAGTGHAQQGRAAKRRSGGSKPAEAGGTADAQPGSSAEDTPQSGARASYRGLAAFQKQVRLPRAPAPG